MRRRRVPRASELPHLAAFVRAYFHEDLIVEYGSATAAVDAFVRDASMAERQAVARELERVADALEKKSAEQVSRFFGETLRAAWAPSSAQELRMLMARIAGTAGGRNEEE
jgi:hypothetical protein